MDKGRKFVINCEFELFGPELNNVVTSCPQLNIHTVGDSIQTAMERLAEAVKFFFDTVEARHELKPVLEALERDNLEVPPWWPENESLAREKNTRGGLATFDSGLD